MKVIKLNIGCGESKLKGFINIDVEKKVKPDLLLDIKRRTLPFKDETVTQINCIHNLEHIELKFWPIVLSQFHRVLKPNGLLILAYPEFERCAKNFIANEKGQKDFWRATLYGRQLYKGDYHVTPMVTPDVIHYLMKVGFDNFRAMPEVDDEYNTFLTCTKCKKPLTREQVINKEVYGKVTKK